MVSMIDYRGVSSITGKWIYWKWNGKLLPGSTKDFWTVVKPETVGRFTELRDKCRVKIYEKDYVSVWIKHETKTRHESVVWCNCDGFLISAHPAHIPLGHRVRNLSDYCGGYSNDCYIIGNSIEGIC